MTVKEWAASQLVNHGMTTRRARIVLSRIVADDDLDVKWNDPMESCPDVFRAVLLMTIAAFAVDYIDEMTPRAFYRPVFAELAGRG